MSNMVKIMNDIQFVVNQKRAEINCNFEEITEVVTGIAKPRGQTLQMIPFYG